MFKYENVTPHSIKPRAAAKIAPRTTINPQRSRSNTTRFTVGSLPCQEEEQAIEEILH